MKRENTEDGCRPPGGYGAAAAADTPQADAGATQTAAQAQKCAGGAAVYRPASGGAGQKNVPQKGRAEETAAQKYSGSDFAAAASGSGVCRRENLGCGAAMGK